MLLIGFAVLTVVVSRTVVNTVFTLRYADLHFGSKEPGIAFGDSAATRAAHLSRLRLCRLHIGMCYQVSDTTIRDRPIPAHTCSPMPCCRMCSAPPSWAAR